MIDHDYKAYVEREHSFPNTTTVDDHKIMNGKTEEARETRMACVKTGQHDDVDRGWAWVVMAASFFSQLISVGMLFTTGVLYVYFLEAFHDSKTMTSLPSSVFLAVSQICCKLHTATIYTTVVCSLISNLLTRL